MLLVPAMFYCGFFECCTFMSLWLKCLISRLINLLPENRRRFISNLIKNTYIPGDIFKYFTRNVHYFKHNFH